MSFIRLSTAVQERRTHWQTLDQARWAYRTRATNGLADAFRRQGRCVLVSPERVAELLKNQQET